MEVRAVARTGLSPVCQGPEGGITAWYTMRLTDIGKDRETSEIGELGDAIRDYEARDAARTDTWLRHFSKALSDRD